MTDPRGQVKLKAGTATYVLQLPINSICDMEEDFSKTRGVEMDCRMIGAQLESAGFRSIRKVVFHALAEHWPEKAGALTEEAAGDVMEKAGLREATVAVGELWRATFPQAPAEDDDGDDGEGEGEEGDEAPPAGNRRARRAAASGNPAKK